MPFHLAKETHQVLDLNGNLISEAPSLTDDEHLQLYRWMVLGRVYSNRMVALQRQGRMGTFAPHIGQEASAAIATNLRDGDWISGSYREMIAYMVKGASILDLMASTRGAHTSGYTPEVGCLPIQIVLATQMLHAAGLAMAMKYEGKPNVSVGVCGDGATSEGDFNEALNFAGVYQAPFVAVVQNNGWAISVPRHKQSATEQLAHRGPAFGLPGYIVDGNDVLAVHKVMKDCIDRARDGGGPSLVELMTYRMGAHTTADDPTKYRPSEDLDTWQKQDPIQRYRTFLRKQDILNDDQDEQLHEESMAKMQAAVEAFESQPPSNPADLFDHVYETPTPQLLAQRDEMLP